MQVKKSRAYCFTWNNYINSSVAQIIQYFDDYNYVFQEETGENGTKHLQGVIRFPNARSIGWQDELPNVIHWERCRNWRKSIAYCTKLDTRTGKVFTNIKGLNIRKSIIDPLAGKELYPFQEAVIKQVNQEPDERIIYWIWDPIGNTGKSSLCKHLILKYGAVIVGGRARDAQYAIIEVLKKRDINIVCFDIPRSQQNHVSYTAIESIKNGCFFSSKYESGQCVFNSPHVIVFSNSEPDKSKLSSDRWVIVRV